MNSFLPAGYQQPKTSKGNFFKPSENKTRVRVMSSAITGWLDWNDKTPVRTKDRPATSFDPKKPAKHFRAFVVYNYDRDELQVWEVTQAMIREQFSTLINGERGNPQWYDIVVWKEGKDLDTKYYITTTPAGIKDVAPEITDKRLNTKIVLEELYENGDPFSSDRF